MSPGSLVVLFRFSERKRTSRSMLDVKVQKQYTQHRITSKRLSLAIVCIGKKTINCVRRGEKEAGKGGRAWEVEKTVAGHPVPYHLCTKSGLVASRSLALSCT